jgi:hypothetical protein
MNFVTGLTSRVPPSLSGKYPPILETHPPILETPHPTSRTVLVWVPIEYSAWSIKIIGVLVVSYD